MTLRKVGVAGAGTMGAGIAQVTAQSGFDVILYDVNEDAVNRSRTNIFKQLHRLAEKGKMPPEAPAEIVARIQAASRLSELRDCELVIEAVPEVMAMKAELFQQLDELCRPDAILATNTSSFSVTAIANQTGSPERVAGLHFFNPAPLMPLVEVIKGIRTGESVLRTLRDFAQQLGKSPVVCEDTPGFIVNRIARPYYNEAIRILGDRVAGVEQIDRIMKQAGGFRMGPFELQDMIGIDINFSTTESVYGGFFGDSRFRPHYVQQRMTQAGKLGRKSGEGYYAYD